MLTNSKKGNKGNKVTNVSNKEKISNISELKNNLLTINLDNVNFEEILGKIKVKELKQTQSKKGSDLYSLIGYNKFFNSESIKIEKKERTKIRKKRDVLINNVLYFASKKESENLKKELNEFSDFYKAIYLKNDLSLNSLIANNSDKDTEEKVKAFLNILKAIKFQLK